MTKEPDGVVSESRKAELKVRKLSSSGSVARKDKVFMLTQEGQGHGGWKEESFGSKLLE